MNRALWTSIAAIGTAQALKISARVRAKEHWAWRDLFRTGGMPSSHSAGAVSLATYIGLKKGSSSISFALASLLSLVVMYDAMGIRRHAGLIAMEVNLLEETVVKLTEQHPPHVHQQRGEDLEERLGHLPKEVLGGALLGVLIGCLGYATESGRTGRFENGFKFIRKSLTGLV
ncbi:MULTISPECIES: divergent PAP2 family protein [unclassified Paenibacillus]|uniref:divergent PAP2 family protein n=1 Tax=unclassified Paenibacillus TaxID=185978 RepID=UPI001AE116A8|nr:MULTISPECIES: divergent PAP2 family protein [unclassified Paenibacillus]MBP1156176.1 acid phosphatase family membrane protein YuiD [Paenibacillus sp. PvP091]MBP1168438.1 acid phosphatase family membrane protein YuiD [Paenibacillus sp. PvR098]MBP2439466.1 acid phosphatase family membrane protein YuiD [Paenibacillus sp. PvP052]